MERVERWRDIIGYENSYSVSDWGRVLSMPKRTRRGIRELRQASDSDGYPIVTLHRNGKQRTRTIHTLIAEAFIAEGTIAKGLEVNHDDGDKRNNRLDNLELVTRRENVRHAVNKLGHRKGEKNAAAKLTAARVRALRESAATGISYATLGQEHGISAVQARNIARGKSWAHAPGPIEVEPRPIGRRASCN